jgi:hypothetical protein
VPRFTFREEMEVTGLLLSGGKSSFRVAVLLEATVDGVET